MTVNTWTVNNTLTMERMMDQGVDFITSDNPVGALKFIASSVK
jgi:glycerophosphoryl diester phosphodiesterase